MKLEWLELVMKAKKCQKPLAFKQGLEKSPNLTSLSGAGDAPPPVLTDYV
jgi:hypothetical protein